MMRAVIIGPGNIAKFHFEAFLRAGFKMEAVLSHPKSKSVKQFCLERKINKIYSSLRELIDFQNLWDVLLISCPTEKSLEYIKKLAPLKKPILVEKPVSQRSKELKEITQYKNVMVGFNRRYYSTIELFKKFINKNDNVSLALNIPESTDKLANGIEQFKRFPNEIYENSIHMFDILNYLVGTVNWTNTLTNKNKNRLFSVFAHGTSARNITINLNINFNSPENYSITAYANTQRAVLKPIEELKIYEGMKIIEPTDESPIRKFVPNMTEKYLADTTDKLKPGFLEQALDFRLFCNSLKPNKAASLTDAFNALKSIENIAELLYYKEQ